LFGPGQPNDEYLDGIIDEAHARGMRVHAWFPICFDPVRLRKHPEWGAVNARGERSRDFVCPTNAAWRQSVLDTFKQLIDNYGVDGVHLDELRLPDAESCQCPACLAALGRRAGKDWPIGLAPGDTPEARRIWLDYRADLIRSLTEALAGAVRGLEDHLVVSAAVRPEGAVDSDGVRLYGQSYEKLGPLLDFLVPMAYHRREDQALAWVKAVQFSGQWRAGSTPVWIGVQAFQEPGRPKGSLDEFGSLLESVRHGSAGVASTPTPRCSRWRSRGTAGTTCSPGRRTWSGVGARASGSGRWAVPPARLPARPRRRNRRAGPALRTSATIVCGVRGSRQARDSRPVSSPVADWSRASSSWSRCSDSSAGADRQPSRTCRSRR
jgi:Glycosyl hydrolase-like 10